jgi:transcription-repair coupling factor
MWRHDKLTSAVDGFVPCVHNVSSHQSWFGRRHPTTRLIPHSAGRSILTAQRKPTAMEPAFAVPPALPLGASPFVPPVPRACSQRRPRFPTACPASSPGSSSTTTASALATDAGADDDFFLPSLDIASIANNTVFGSGATNIPTSAQRQLPSGASSPSAAKKPARRTKAAAAAAERKAEAARTATVSQQRQIVREDREKRRIATEAAAETDLDFMQAARDAIAMADLPSDTAGVADVSIASDESKKSHAVPQRLRASAKSALTPRTSLRKKSLSATTDSDAVVNRSTSLAVPLAQTDPRTGDGILGSSILSVGDDIDVSDLFAHVVDGQSSTAALEGASESAPIFTGEKIPTALESAGFDVKVKPLTAATDASIAATATARGSKPTNGTPAEPTSTYNQKPEFVIRPGNLVMHSRHGVGRFRGLEHTTASQEPTQEYAVVEYRDGDVYIPLSQLESLRRLTTEQEESITQLDTVSGSASFNDSADQNNMRARRVKYNARVKARAKIREQLVNLHGLYAARESVTRPKYKPYPVEESEFMSQCDFDLTSDQDQAVAEVLSDISDKDRPMDRLLCGDVGFGKTEVALRCAFRVLMSGRQVAVLAPTTILAQQHFETFKERFEAQYPDFPVACLTRFVPRKTVLETRERVRTGEAKIVIGTHILLGDSTQFHNLGLLIVDEEHRFGVNQKEKLRCKHHDVDTLFLSATPIPRTLHLALSGLRDTSILKVPPPGRKPVITRIAASGAGVVRQALSNELARKGQVFFVCPRIEGIEATANWVKELFPEAKVLVAHGSHKDLERRIWAFAAGQYDVLVCTSIIENGINMPRVNTMVVQDAARFGMAQLHQLRGRVGRCDLQAYAWMLYSKRPGGDTVPAHERLRALERFSGLGAGFAIAQRDMEMRGVGTVLGVEQHGNSTMDAEEYSKMLIEELEAAKTGKPVPMTLPVASDTAEVYLPVASYIPPEYIKDLDEKMTTYSIMSNVQSTDELASVSADLERRYGPLPVPVHRHICIIRLKLLSKRLGIRRVLVERQHVVLDWAIDNASLTRLVSFLDMPERERNRFECIEADERVQIRGLGVCGGDLIVAKLLQFVSAFVRASVNFASSNGTPSNLPGLLRPDAEVVDSPTARHIEESTFVLGEE